MEGFFGSSGGVGGGVLLAADEMKKMVWARSLDFEADEVHEWGTNPLLLQIQRYVKKRVVG